LKILLKFEIEGFPIWLKKKPHTKWFLKDQKLTNIGQFNVWGLIVGVSKNDQKLVIEVKRVIIHIQ
jgi:hypothetical protein